MLKLYWAPRTRAFRILWLLEEAGLPYELELVDIRAGAQDTQAFRRINPMGKVPALADGDAHVSESGAICAYVAEKAPHLAPPVGDPLRARYLTLLFFSSGCVEAAYVQRMAGVNLPKVSAGWGSFDLVMDVIDQSLANGPWLLGDRFSAADAMLGLDLWYGIHLLKAVEPTPRMADYVARLAARPAFQRAEAIEAETLAAVPAAG